jgi:hypothetical protein
VKRRRREAGAIAQLVERVLCKHEVVGSIPSGSTILRSPPGFEGRARREADHSSIDRNKRNNPFPAGPLHTGAGQVGFTS